MEYKFDDKKKVYLLKGNGDVSSLIRIISSSDVNDGKLTKSGRKLSKGKMTSDSYSSMNKIKDTLFLVCGGCKLGSMKKESLSKYLDEIEQYGKENNSHFVFVRGQYDDPSLFDGKEIATEHVVAIPNYSVIESCGKRFLCISGSVSYDRSWPYGCAYEGEKPVYERELIDTNVDVVITEVAPSFIEPPIDLTSQWVKTDKELKKDLIEERHIMDLIYTQFDDGKHRSWYITKYNNERYTTLSFFNFISIYSCKLYELAIDLVDDIRNVSTGGAYSVEFTRALNEIRMPRNLYGVEAIPAPYVIADAAQPAEAENEERGLAWDEFLDDL